MASHDPAVRRTLLTLLPKVLLSRLTGAATGVPLPKALRPLLLGWFARRYGADLEEMEGQLEDYRSFAAFFGRPLKPGARPLGVQMEPDGKAQGRGLRKRLVSPCDGRVVTAGAIDPGPDGQGEIPQVKGQNYSVAELLGDPGLAAKLLGGHQLTVYLAPGDYHRVHAPFAGSVGSIRGIPGTLFPVNPPAVRVIRELYLRNARVVFPFQLEGDGVGAVVMVGALNVGRMDRTAARGDVLAAGDEVGRFGFGSSVVILWRGGVPGWSGACPAPVPGQVLRMGQGLIG